MYEGYWKDIGTIRSFWETNLSLTDPVPEFSFYDRDIQIYTHMRYLPPSKINACALDRCLLSEGCVVSGKHIRHSIIGIRAVVGEGTVIEDSVIMGADDYEWGPSAAGQPAVGIGRNCVIKQAIVDKNCRIGNDCYISPEGKDGDVSTDLYTVRDGVIVIPKNTVIPDGTRL